MRKLYRKMEKKSLAMSPKRTYRPMLLETTLRFFFYVSVLVAMVLFFQISKLLIFFSSLLFLRLFSVFLLYLSVRKRLDDTGIAIPFLCWDFIFPFINIFRLIR
jgi:hypothetical protein